MADNIAITPGLGAIVRTKTLTGIATQVFQLDIGGESAEVQVTAGQKPMATSLPVTIASDQSAIPFSGTLNSNAGTGWAASGLAIETGGNLASVAANTSRIPALGQALAASSVPVVLTAAQLTTLTPLSTVAVTGTFWQATQPISAASLPLPTGAALETGGNLATIATNTNKIPALGQALAASSVPVVLTAAQLTTLTPLSSVGITGTVTVSGTVTANAGTGTLTVGQATGTNLHTVVDSGSITATISGTPTISGTVTVQQATASILNAAVVGNVAAGSADSGNGVKIAGVYNTSAPTLTNAQRGDVQLDSSGNLKVNIVAGSSSGTQYAQGTTQATPTGTVALGITPSNVLNALALDASGYLKVNVAAGSAANAAASATGSAVPSSADYSGINVAGTLRGQTGVNPSGSVYAAQTDMTSVGGSALTIGQQVAGASLPVVLPATQIATLTPPTTVTVTQPTGTNLHAVLDSGSTTVVTQATGTNLHTVVDSGTVTISGTATVSQATGSNLHTVIDSGTTAVTQATASSLNATVVGPGTAGTPSGGVLSIQGVASGTAIPISGSVSISGTPTISGTVTVQQATAANLNATIVQATAANLNAQVVGNVAAGTADSGNGIKIAGVYNTAAPTLTNAQRGDIQLDSSGNIKVNIAAGSSSDTQYADGATQATPTGTIALAKNPSNALHSLAIDASGNLNVNVAAGSAANAAASATAAAVPTNAGYTGINVGGNLRGLTGLSVGSAYAAHIAIVDGSGTQITTFGGGTQYADGATQATPTGTIALGKNGSNLLHALSLDGSGNLNVNVAAGSAANAAASATGSAVPASADYGGINVAGTLRGQTGVNPTGSIYAAQMDLTSVGGASIAIGQQLAAASLPVILPAATITTLTPPTTVTVTQATGTNLHAVLDSTSTTAVTQATAANLNATVVGLGTAGTSTGGVLSIQGVASGTAVPVSGTFWQATQPISGTVTANAGTGSFTVAQATAANLNAQVVGTVASGASDSGNPIKTSGVFNTTQPTVTTGQRVDAQATARGARIVATGVDTFNVTVNAALPTGANIIGKVTTDQTTHGTTDLVAADITKVGGVSFALNQQLAAASLPVVLTAAQMTTLTPPTTVTVQQATGTNLHAVLDSTSTTAVTQATASNLNAQVVGNVASGAADSGNGVKGAFVVNTSPPAYTNGQRGDMQGDATGQLRTNSGFGTAVSLTTAPANLTASTSTTYTFAQQVYHVLIQNNSTAAVGVAFSGAASAGSFQVPAVASGVPGTVILPVQTTNVSLYSTAATAVNGTAAGNIVLLGFL